MVSICDKVPLLCDNESAIKISYNPVDHTRTKHIEIRHHFIRDHVAWGDTELSYVSTKDQLADIFMKPLDEARFCYLRTELNIIDSRSLTWSPCILTYVLTLIWFRSRHGDKGSAVHWDIPPPYNANIKKFNSLNIILWYVSFIDE